MIRFATEALFTPGEATRYLRHHARLRVVGAWVAVLLTCTSVARAQVESSLLPPPSLQGPAQYITFFRSADRQLVAGAKWEMAEKLVTVRTTWLRPGADDVKSFVKCPVRYWPTCVSKIADGTLCVAGRSPRSGNTIVELWRMKAPSIAGNGVLSNSTLDSVTELYDAKVAGREDVRAVLPLWASSGSAESVLLWFEQSREVWRLRISSGEAVLVATPAVVGSSGTPAIHAPYLAQATRAWAGIEVGAGYVYTFDRRSNDVPLDVNQPSLLVLRDVSRDSVIESAVLESPAALIAAGWNQSTHWMAW